MGQLLAARIVDAMKSSSAWDSSVLFLTYDAGGGYFDHVAPTILENVPQNLPEAGTAVGPAFRVPLFIVSPWARPGTVFKPVVDHTSIQQFIERTFSTKTNPVFLPTIDPARRSPSSLMHGFDFTQTPNSPTLPTAKQLFSPAKQEILTQRRSHGGGLFDDLAGLAATAAWHIGLGSFADEMQHDLARVRPAVFKHIDGPGIGSAHLHPIQRLAMTNETFCGRKIYPSGLCWPLLICLIE
jgi:hypothetical protein